MRRLVVATTALALGAGALAALPVGAASAGPIAPTLLSVTASPGSVTTVGKLNAAKKVTVTAVFKDPEAVLKNAAFSNSGPLTPGVGTNAKDFTAVVSGERRTFSWTFDEDYNSVPGVRRAYVVGQVGYGTNIDGTAGSTTYVVKNKPLLSLTGSRSLSYIWGTKARLVGNLTSTPAHANRKITIQFDRKGKQPGKRWVVKQTLRTDASGSFQTKKFRIDKAGTWRAVHAGTAYVLGAKATYKVANPYTGHRG